MELTVNLRKLHDKQHEIKASPAKRKVIRAGRRGGKTTLVADDAVDRFLDGGRILYGVPTAEQVDRFWFECCKALAEPIEAGVYTKNQTRHIIELPGTEQRIRAKTAWDSDTLRGDYGDLIILDEFQDMDPDALEDVVYPMLLDNDGDLMIVYTSRRINKGGRGLKKANELYKRAQADTSGRWSAFKFTSLDNPYLSKTALTEITQDMTNLSYRAEIMAEELEDDPNALWTRGLIDTTRWHKDLPELFRVMVGVDPPGGSITECGIVAGGTAYVEDELHLFILDDASRAGKPNEWGQAVVDCYHKLRADRILGEQNFGGEMVENTIRVVDPSIAYTAVHASRGKAVRAEPVSAWYEKGRIHHVGEFPALEDEMATWVPGMGMPSPNRLDALVWLATEALGGSPSGGIYV